MTTESPNVLGIPKPLIRFLLAMAALVGSIALAATIVALIYS